MEQRRTAVILGGVLFAGIAAASALWLAIMPRAAHTGPSEAQAQKMGYASAAEYQRLDDMSAAVFRTANLTDRQAAQLEKDLRSDNPNVVSDALLVLDTWTERSRDPAHAQKAITMTLSTVDHPHADARWVVADRLNEFASRLGDRRSEQALTTMAAGDPDEKVRKHATDLLDARRLAQKGTSQ